MLIQLLSHAVAGVANDPGNPRNRFSVRVGHGNPPDVMRQSPREVVELGVNRSDQTGGRLLAEVIRSKWRLHRRRSSPLGVSEVSVE
jgi:hypothetical protein